jgi:hypothetical protein
MPLQATSGAGSYDAFGGGVPVVPNYIEEVFSTYLYTGNDPSTQNIINGIDLSTKGGMIWQKGRSYVGNHVISDTVRGLSGGRSREIYPNLTNAEDVDSSVTAFYNNGFRAGANGATNSNGGLVASWTFRKQPKFFDVVTYTGTGSNTTISHALGSVPACIMVKRTDTTGDWQVYHRSLANTEYLVLNTTAAKATGATRWNSTTPTSTVFSIGTDATVNASGGTYVAYIFAHDAGGFGLTGTDNVISCGSLNTGGSGTSGRVNLGWEPQFVIIKRTNITEGWMQFDNMRGLGVLYNANKLNLNTSGAEQGLGADECFIDSTGFTVGNVGNNQDFVYIAIRRGPMKVPTSGTSVFTPVASRSSGTSQATPIFNAGFPVDTLITGIKAGGGSYWIPRLAIAQMTSSSTAAETSASSTYNFGGMLGILSASGGDLSNSTVCGWNLKRAPAFHDVVCYSGDSTLGRAIPHNLAAVPELMIVKNRNNTENWVTYSAPTGNTTRMILNSTAASGTRAVWADTTPTSTNFYVGGSGVLGETNFSSYIYVAYLFATLAGVSKVGSYTGTGTTLQIDCGFTAGARFVLIKRTNSTGDWYVWDTARGIVSGNDPYLLLNSTAAEVTSTDYIDTYSAGFEISSTAPAAINASGGTYIFLAIA